MEKIDKDLALVKKLLEIYDQKQIADFLNKVSPKHWCRETINRWLNGKAAPGLRHNEFEELKSLLPSPPPNHPHYDFKFIDLFAVYLKKSAGNVYLPANGICQLSAPIRPTIFRTRCITSLILISARSR